MADINAGLFVGPPLVLKDADTVAMVWRLAGYDAAEAMLRGIIDIRKLNRMEATVLAAKASDRKLIIDGRV